MFTKSELNQIDQNYFNIINSSAFHIILESRNTKHIWDIYCGIGFRGRSLEIYHKHHSSESFHRQKRMHPRTIFEAQTMIKSHDEWHINGRKY